MPRPYTLVGHDLPGFGPAPKGVSEFSGLEACRKRGDLFTRLGAFVQGALTRPASSELAALRLPRRAATHRCAPIDCRLVRVCAEVDELQ